MAYRCWLKSSFWQTCSKEQCLTCSTWKWPQRKEVKHCNDEVGHVVMEPTIWKCLEGEVQDTSSMKNQTQRKRQGFQSNAHHQTFDLLRGSSNAEPNETIYN